MQSAQSSFQPMEQGSSMKVWYIVGIVALLALAAWFVYGGATPAADTSALEQTQISGLTSGDTTADISADFNQLPDTATALDADAAASAQAVSGL